jgi:hypothetical protein
LRQCDVVARLEQGSLGKLEALCHFFTGCKQGEPSTHAESLSLSLRWTDAGFIGIPGQDLMATNLLLDQAQKRLATNWTKCKLLPARLQSPLVTKSANEDCHSRTRR